LAGRTRFVGALGDRRKGFDTLFRAWTMLCGDAGWNADLVVVGAGAELPWWRRRAAESGIAPRIRFLGFRRDVPELFRAFDAHVLPSRYESYSLVTQEALACGLPAFVSRVSGIAERYPDELRELVISDPDDAHSLADRLRRWAARAEGYRASVAPLCQLIRAFTWDDMAARVAEIIESISICRLTKRNYIYLK
jgi:glycosyltransferase involved in cell wall biosynthesis